MTLADRADTSTRHLSFIETGRSHPSNEMLLRLAEKLDIPLRTRNALLASAGYAPAYRETGLSSPEMLQVRKTLEFILRATDPYPAMIIDRYWNVLSENPPLRYLIETFVVDKTFYDPQYSNLARMVLHPRGWQPVIQNFDEFEPFMINRIRRMVTANPDDTTMADLLDEVTDYESSSRENPRQETYTLPQIIMPIHLKNDEHEVRIFTTTATLGAPQDITLQELRIEAGFPMDEETDLFFIKRLDS